MVNRKLPTMKDVAALAKVSIQTVSAIINGKPGITPETTIRVKNAIQQLSYRPYSIARSLRTRQTHTIALIVSDISNPSFSTIASSAEDIAHSFGYTLVFYNTHDDAEREAGYIRSITERWIDGAIFVATGDQMTSLDSLKESNIPTVAVDRIPVGYTGPSVTLDNIKAGRLAAEHLVNLGHNCIAHISGPLKLSLARERKEGFCQVIQERGLEPGPCGLSEGNWECESGFEAMRQILRSKIMPTAVFAANDRMAIGAIRAIFEAGLSVPRDISIIGLDDIEVSAFTMPPLTTVRQSFEKMASLSIHLLIDILAGKEPDRQRVVLDPELVIRQSTASPSKEKIANSYNRLIE
jgi:LacI family transcriptional regulator